MERRRSIVEISQHCHLGKRCLRTNELRGPNNVTIVARIPNIIHCRSLGKRRPIFLLLYVKRNPAWLVPRHPGPAAHAYCTPTRTRDSLVRQGTACARSTSRAHAGTAYARFSHLLMKQLLQRMSETDETFGTYALQRTSETDETLRTYIYNICI